MSTDTQYSLERFIGALKGVDDAGWERLANPLSFYIRNGALLGLVGALWFTHDSVWWWLVVVGCVLIMRLSVLVPRCRRHNHWHVQAIAGERLVVLDGVKTVPRSLRLQVWILKLFDVVSVMGVVYGLVVYDGVVVVLATTIFMVVRLLLLGAFRYIWISLKDA
jgi:hypothetical protein